MRHEEKKIKSLQALLLAGILLLFGTTTHGNTNLPIDQLLEIPLEVTLLPEEKASEFILNPYEWEALAHYLYQFKTKSDHGIWNICGKRLNDQEMKAAAYAYSRELLKAHHTTFYTIKRGRVKHKVKVPLQGVVGVMISESRLDYCAIGPHPRKWAYKHKLLKPNPKGTGTPSFTQEEILKVLNHPTWRKRLADLGPGQMVWGRNAKAIFKGEPEELLSLSPGIKHVFEEMADRGHRKNSVRPWIYWPGERPHHWYDIRIMKFIRQVFAH